MKAGNTRNTKKRMKGEITLKILEILERVSCGIGDLFLVFALPYTASLNEILNEIEKRKSSRGQWAQDLHERMKARERIYKIIFYLKKDQLIKGSHAKGFHLTRRGRKILEKLRKRRAAVLPDTHYTIAPHTNWVVIVYDVPEREKLKRIWLRSALKNLDFRMLQKSVWIGKGKLPKIFLNDLERLGLLPHIHIFTINKAGSASIFLEEE